MRSRLNGWQRLWVVLMTLWALLLLWAGSQMLLLDYVPDGDVKALSEQDHRH
jgi:hypothetical protein